MKNKVTQGNLSSGLLILIFVILATGILITGYFLYTYYAKSYRTQVEQQLSTIADLKVGELVQWRKERLSDANQLYKNPAFSSLVQRYFEHPDDVNAQEQLRSWLAHFQAYDQYARIFLLDTQGAARISVPHTAETVPHHIPQDANKVLQSDKVTLLDLDRDEDTPQPHMVILTPIFRQTDTDVPLGVVVMRIDPYQYLYPLIQSWPTPSTTAETLLVRRDGNDALFLNDLRFQKDTALKLHTSLDNIKMPAVQAALGHEGIMEGIDYRDVPVIADVRHIPDSPWFMVARIDISEVYAPLTQILWLIIALVSALLIVAGAGVSLVWRQQNIRVYKERAEIVEALQESELRYRDLVNFSKNGVAIYEAAADGEDFIFTDFNRAAESIDNVKKEDIIGKSVLQTFPGVKEFGLFEVFQRVWRTGVPVRHPIAHYHDERISGWRDNYVYRLSSGEIVAIYADVTIRKKAEEALQESEALLKEAQEVAHVGHWELDLKTMVPAWSDEVFHIFGIDRAAGEPSFAAHRDLLHPDDWDILSNAVRATSTTGAPFEIEFRLLHPQKGIRWMHAIGRATRDDKGNISRLFGTAQDITDSKNTEKELEKSRQELRDLSERLINLREEERTLLAREIHDELGQALTALKMDLSWLSKKLPEGQGPMADKTASMLKLVDTTVKTVKRLSTELRPGLLDDLGLVAAMEWQANEFQARTGIKTELSFEPDDIMVDNERATALFRIFQEILTNIIRHAAATRIDVYLHEKDEALELSVRDNGKGIAPKMLTSSKSLGLIGMRERCHHLGGAVDIRGKPGKGTTVTVNLPAGEILK